MIDKADKNMNIEFHTCPGCNGYGVLDNGTNCKMCGGVGRHDRGGLGSGEIMIDKDTGQRVTAAQLAKRLAASGGDKRGQGFFQ